MRIPTLLLLGFLSLTGCSSWAEIHGPTAGIALRINHDLEVTPTLRAGYHYTKFSMALQYGGRGGIDYSPLKHRIELFAEAQGGGVLFINSPFFAGSALGWSPSTSWTWAIRAGINPYLFAPPGACNEGWFEWTDERPPCSTVNEYQVDDLVFPTWLPQIGYRFDYLRSFSGDTQEFGHSLSFDATAALWWLDGSQP